MIRCLLKIYKGVLCNEHIISTFFFQITAPILNVTKAPFRPH